MNIFLRYEITARELDANILTGLVAASRGHRAIVCDWPMMMRGILLRRRQSGFVHMNSLTPGKSALIFHRIFKFFGYQISSLDQEAGIQRSSYESFAEVRFGEATMSSADLIFCWGSDDYEALQRLYPKHKNKIVLSGSPRVDLWRPKFASVYTRVEKLVSPYLLVLSSLQGPLLYDRLHERLISRRDNGFFERHPQMEAHLVGHHKEGADLMLSYLKLIRSLSENYPELGIIVKAHPGENPEIWRGILGKTVRVHVDMETPTSQLIRESIAVISTGSTAVFEVVLSETPLISFQPVETPYRDRGFADRIGFLATTQEEVHGILRDVLNREIDKGLNRAPDPSSVDIRRKVYFDVQELAAERMVNSWERALERESHLPPRGSIFSMPSEELKYFIASAFPALIPLFVRKTTKSMPTGSQKSLKRPILERKLVKARLKEMQSLLGLQDSVVYSFKGRRGLVIEPTRSPGSNENSDS